MFSAADPWREVNTNMSYVSRYLLHPVRLFLPTKLLHRYVYSSVHFKFLADCVASVWKDKCHFLTLTLKGLMSCPVTAKRAFCSLALLLSFVCCVLCKVCLLLALVTENVDTVPDTRTQRHLLLHAKAWDRQFFSCTKTEKPFQVSILLQRHNFMYSILFTLLRAVFLTWSLGSALREVGIMAKSSGKVVAAALWAGRKAGHSKYGP